MTATRVGLRTLLAALLALLLTLAATGASSAQEAPVGLGTAGGFAILAATTITNTGPSTITGDVGVHPGEALVGDDEWTHDGAEHVGDAVAEGAQNDLDTAYLDAAGRDATTIATELGGETLEPGVYDSAAGTFGVTGTLTLDALGDPDAVFIFQMGSTLTTASGSAVVLENGAQACNVFWQVGSSATLGTDSTFAGNILALASITVNSGATIEGRLLAREAAVTIDTATITRAVCTDGVDDDGTDADGTDADGTDADGTDADGTDDGTDGTDDGTDAGGTDTDGIDDDGTDDDGTDGTDDGADGTDGGDGTDGQVTTAGPPGAASPPGLPRTGAPLLLIVLGAGLVAVGREAVKITRPGRHSA